MITEMIIRSRCHEDLEGVGEIAHEYEWMGTTHKISRGEVDAVERSGKCSWQWWAATPTIPHRHVIVSQQIRDMSDRSGATHPGYSPVPFADYPKAMRTARDPYYVLPTPRRINEAPDVWHLRKNGAATTKAECGVRGKTGLVFGFTRFGRTINNPKTCEACRMAYDGEIAAASSRSRFGKCSSR